MLVSSRFLEDGRDHQRNLIAVTCREPGRSGRHNVTGAATRVRQDRCGGINSITGRHVQHRLQPDVDETGHEMGCHLLGYGGLLSKRQ